MLKCLFYVYIKWVNELKMIILKGYMMEEFLYIYFLKLVCIILIFDFVVVINYNLRGW